MEEEDVSEFSMYPTTIRTTIDSWQTRLQSVSYFQLASSLYPNRRKNYNIQWFIYPSICATFYQNYEKLD